MSIDLEERVWAYLDGEMDDAEVKRFERDLLEATLAQALSETLLMRELLRSVGPSDAPAELFEETEAAVLRDVAEAHPEYRRRLLGRTRAALGGLGWALRGPQLAMAGSLEPARSGLSEIGNTRYSLGPLADLGRGRGGEQPVAPKRSLWRRVLRRGK